MDCRIGNGAGFWGDSLDAPRRLVEAAELDFLTLEYLAELTMSILARQREKDPARGYVTDLVPVIHSLTAALTQQQQLRVVTNAGGMNPQGCASAVARVLTDAGLASIPLATVTGDDLMAQIPALLSDGWTFDNFETGEPLGNRLAHVVSANAYLGAAPIADALGEGARVVITGRVADASLTVGPALHTHGWSLEDLDHLAAATVAGHLIECGAQVSGGFYTHWPELDLADVGYPIAELQDSGACIITKPNGTGGRVSRETVCEQLVYEIGDPNHYLTPDVDADFTTVTVHDEGSDRVRVQGATGRPAPETLKVSLAYRAGYMASSQLLIYGRQCVAKAHSCAELIFARLARAGFAMDRKHVELLGTGASAGQPPRGSDELREVVLRISVQDLRRDAVERFAREITPLATSGPAGLAGYTSGRAQVRPAFAYWPTTIPRDRLCGVAEVRPARAWLDGMPK